MADGKNSIVVYADWIKKFEVLNDDEAGRLIKHFFRYVNDLNPKAPDRITELSFIDIEQCLKRDLIKWEKRAERSRENGKNGGRPPKEQENPEKPTKTQQVIEEPKKPDSVNVSVSGSVNGSDIKKESIVGLTTSAPTDGTPPIKERCQLFIDKFNSQRIVKGKKSKFRYSEQVCTALKNRLKKYEAREIFKALKNALSDEFHINSEYFHLTPEYILREKTLEKYLNMGEVSLKTERGLVH